jgi:hypothetical protein
MTVQERIIVAVRWGVRGVGLLLLGLILAFAVGEGVPNPFRQPATVNLLSSALLAMVAGLLIAWKWEGIGGCLILGGWGYSRSSTAACN